jgi:hypothetical protein
MPNAKRRFNASSSRSAKTRASVATNNKRATSVARDSVVFLNVGVSKRARAGLNKLVTVMNATNQREVLEQLIASELHRHNMRLPSA